MIKYYYCKSNVYVYFNYSGPWYLKTCETKRTVLMKENKGKYIFKNIETSSNEHFCFCFICLNSEQPLFDVSYFKRNKEHKMLHRMADKVYLLYWKGQGQDYIFS